jgi:lipid II:glycine glycyltransferase (peptidoglycan interpeptide bridge formation enzyme)
MNIKFINPADDKRWDELVISHPHASVFHTSAWAKAIIEAYNYQPRYLVMENNHGKYVAGMPLFLVKSRLTGTRLVCLPFSDYCYPISEDNDNLEILLETAKKEMEVRGASYIEIRGWHPGVPSPGLQMTPYHYHLYHTLGLEVDINVLEKKLHSNARGSIRRARKNNITLRYADSEKDLKQFYRLNVMTRKKNQVFPQPYSFFKTIFCHLLQQEMGGLMIAEWEGKPIAAALYLTYKNTIYYKYNASDARYLNRCPNHLLTWEMIKKAYDTGVTKLDFGRCSPDNEGLRTWKKRWSACEFEYPYYFYPTLSGVPTLMGNTMKYRAMNMFTRVMPRFASTAIGSFLYKHLG